MLYEHPLMRFLRFINKTDSGCWEWKNKNGMYSSFNNGIKLVRPHQFSYYVWVGDVPEGMQITRVCKNDFCVNPEHLKADIRSNYRKIDLDIRLSRYLVNPATGCWEWSGSRNACGYGTMGYEQKTALAHRVSYMHHVGPVGDLQVLHRCDNPACINPEHLFLGTQIDNIEDMINKKRNSFGGNSKSTKLNEVSVRRIRELFQDGANKYDLASLFNVDESTIRGVVKRKYWRHIA